MAQARDDVVATLTAALEPDDVVFGGGNAKISRSAARCRLGDNANAFRGGFRLWDNPYRKDGST